MATSLRTQVSLRDSMLSAVETELRSDSRAGRRSTSKETAKLVLQQLTEIIKNKKWKHAQDLLRILREFGNNLVKLDPTETVVGNVIRRVLKIIRDDYLRVHCGHSPDTQIKLLLPHAADDFATTYVDLQDHILESLDEFQQEIDFAVDSIAQHSQRLITDGEVVLTVGKSRTVEAFLREAAIKRHFTVIVVESAPNYHGHELARTLGKQGVSTFVINDSAVFAMMGRVHKVILGTHSVMADGGLKAYSGAYAVALAAKHYSVPLVVCTPVYKLTPQFVTSEDQPDFNKLESPLEIFDFAGGDRELDDTEFLNPIFDYVPPDLVPLFIFNVGGNSPSYVYRLVSELYHPDDYDLSTVL
ncbi:translation initiation factor eIF-2B subunit beta-like [Tropilaelaps mercedesae]|uniref:Translation initiation factor eIF2B subunit beta n=1 Tax=Tropilaelaps mercedesae TaxID=418985 RepID=A0A1V9XX93_9ACAR|nr:translation initiation factor eIF-2B subunit beta-like [Tropilaelaps mercedesae]